MNKILGNLSKRIDLNRKRLGDDIYRYDNVLSYVGNWYGDFPGRAILALCSLYKASAGYKDKQADIKSQLKDIFDHLDEHTNKYCYYGPLFNPEAIDEQQISGNSWFLRGLVEYYNLFHEVKVYKYLETIANNYLIPLSKYYLSYPINSLREEGEVAGHTAKDSDSNWILSSDVGCAFIMLDGITALYSVTKQANIKTVIEMMIDKFLTIDFVNLKCQTHATLSCARGIFRFYKATNDPKYLDDTICIFDKYYELGMTIDYSNINWFKRPDTWTEPCCIVDSLILAKWLAIETKQEKYLDIYNKIFVNTIRTFQRNNGGAGCSTCAYGENNAIKMHLYEAWFCCTMRLGEGLFEASDFAAIKIKDLLIVPCNTDVNYIDDNNDIVILNNIYETKKIHVKVNKLNDIKTLLIYVPNGTKVNGSYTQGRFLKLSLIDNFEADFKAKMSVKNIDEVNFEGDMILTRKDEKVDEYYVLNGQNYSPIYDNSKFTEEELKGKIQYVK